MTRPARHYKPLRRPGARQEWPPNDAWSLEDLVAEMQFWRTLAHLMPFTVDSRTPVPAPPTIPAQRSSPHEDRWNAFVTTAYKTGRFGKPPHGAAARSVAARNVRRARDV